MISYGVYWLKDSPEIGSSDGFAAFDLEEAEENGIDSPLKAVRFEVDNALVVIKNHLEHLPEAYTADLEAQCAYIATEAHKIKRLRELEADYVRNGQWYKHCGGHEKMQRDKPRKRAQIGRDARGILLKCDSNLFHALHQRATQENKSLNLTLIEVVERGLNVKNPMPADG